jgi:hypothetical protein
MVAAEHKHLSLPRRIFQHRRWIARLGQGVHVNARGDG